MNEFLENDISESIKRADEVNKSLKPLIQDLHALGKSENEIIEECVFWGFMEGLRFKNKKGVKFL